MYQWLGPVKAPSFRVASRMANGLRAGHAVRDYEDLGSCPLILISVPDAMVPAIVREVAAANINWRRRAIVLCSAALDSSALDDLAARGASIASLCVIPNFEYPRFLVEGDHLAILHSKRLVENSIRNIVAIERSLKPFYLAALSSTSSLLFAVLHAASECLSHAGISDYDSTAILQRQVPRTLRSQVRVGRKAYAAPHQLEQQLHVLASADAELAHYLGQSAILANRLLRKS